MVRCEIEDRQYNFDVGLTWFLVDIQQEVVI